MHWLEPTFYTVLGPSRFLFAVNRNGLIWMKTAIQSQVDIRAKQSSPPEQLCKQWTLPLQLCLSSFNWWKPSCLSVVETRISDQLAFWAMLLNLITCCLSRKTEALSLMEGFDLPDIVLKITCNDSSWEKRWYRWQGSSWWCDVYWWWFLWWWPIWAEGGGAGGGLALLITSTPGPECLKSTKK